jgi:hypothetical protein
MVCQLPLLVVQAQLCCYHICFPHKRWTQTHPHLGKYAYVLVTQFTLNDVHTLSQKRKLETGRSDQSIQVVTSWNYICTHLHITNYFCIRSTVFVTLSSEGIPTGQKSKIDTVAESKLSLFKRHVLNSLSFSCCREAYQCAIEKGFSS